MTGLHLELLLSPLLDLPTACSRVFPDYVRHFYTELDGYNSTHNVELCTCLRPR